MLRHFRLSVVKEGADLPVFRHAGALTKLALWLEEAIKEEELAKGKRKHYPLVLAALNEELDMYLVVGTSVTEHVQGQTTGDVRNKFGLAFHSIARENRARVRIDSFETSVIEVRRADLAGFLENLSLRM